MPVKGLIQIMQGYKGQYGVYRDTLDLGLPNSWGSEVDPKSFVSTALVGILVGPSLNTRGYVLDQGSVCRAIVGRQDDEKE